MEDAHPQERTCDEKVRLSQIGRGNLEALGAVYDAYARRLYAYARALGASESFAEDILQEVFLRLIRRSPARRAVKNLRAYLFAATRREFYRWGSRLVRRKEIENRCSVRLFESRGSGKPAEEVKYIEKALFRLPKLQREVVMMKFFGGLTFEEIAEVMETSVNTVASRYRYALEKLRAFFGKR